MPDPGPQPARPKTKATVDLMAAAGDVVIVNVSGLDDEQFAEELLREEKVGVVPGRAFGPSGIGHVRVCYATAYEQIVEAMDRIERFVERRRGAAA